MPLKGMRPALWTLTSAVVRPNAMRPSGAALAVVSCSVMCTPCSPIGPNSWPGIVSNSWPGIVCALSTAISRSLRLLLVVRTQRQNHAAVELVPDLRDRSVHGREAHEDAFPAGDLGDHLVPRPLADGEQQEQDGQAQEHGLQRAVDAQRADVHERGEQAPRQQIVAESRA